MQKPFSSGESETRPPHELKQRRTYNTNAISLVGSLAFPYFFIVAYDRFAIPCWIIAISWRKETQGLTPDKGRIELSCFLVMPPFKLSFGLEKFNRLSQSSNMTRSNRPLKFWKVSNQEFCFLLSYEWYCHCTSRHHNGSRRQFPQDAGTYTAPQFLDYQTGSSQ